MLRRMSDMEELPAGCVQRAASGDESAFAEIVRRYGDPVFAFLVRSTRDRMLAEDLAQETFLKAWRALPRYRPRPGARFSTWLFGIARNLAIDDHRRRSRAAWWARFGSQPPPPATPPSDDLDRSELAATLAAAVNRLPENQRSAILLAEYEGATATDIGSVLGCSSRAAESLLFRARAAVRDEIRRTHPEYIDKG